MDPNRILSTISVFAAMGAAGTWWAASFAPSALASDDGGLVFAGDFVQVPHADSLASGQVDVSVDDELQTAQVTLLFDNLKSPIVGASIHASSDGDLGNMLVDLTGEACQVSGDTSGIITCTVSQETLFPCSDCGIGGSPVGTIEDFAFLVEEGLAGVIVRGDENLGPSSFGGTELYAELGLKFNWHFSGCQNKPVGSGTIHMAGCTTATWRPFKKASEWEDWGEGQDLDGGISDGTGPDGFPPM